VATELLVLLLLVLANGTFALSEMAIVSSRKARLQVRAQAGDRGARSALQLAEHPNRFLSTVQIGITLVGIFAGAYGGATIAARLAPFLEQFALLRPYSREVAVALVVGAVTYVSLVLGELVPKRIALTHPEKIAARVAGFMHGVSVVATPAVKLLSLSTDALLRLLRVRKGADPPVTEEEIATLIDQGTQAGVFEKQEREIIERVFWLGDQRAGALMTPRHRVIWLDVNAPFASHRDKMAAHRHSRFPVCDGAADRILGIVDVRELFACALSGDELDLRRSLQQPLFVPSGLRALRLIDMFRDTGMHFAVVIDEHGGVAGVITLNDVLEEISGEFLTDQPRISRRDDGSWLVDASLAVDSFAEALDIEKGWPDVPRDYHTVGGYVLATLGHIPKVGESVVEHGYRIEVVDMDGHRIDKLLVSRIPAPSGPARPDRR